MELKSSTKKKLLPNVGRYTTFGNISCHRSFCFCLDCFAQVEKDPSFFRQCTICKKSPDMTWFLEQIQKLNFSSLEERSNFEARYIHFFDPKFKNYRPRPTPPSDVPGWAILHDDFPYMLPNAVASGAVLGAAGLVCGGALSLGGWLTSLEVVKLSLSCAGGMCCFNMIPVICPREIYLEDAIEEHREECRRKALKNAAKERLKKESEKKNL